MFPSLQRHIYGYRGKNVDIFEDDSSLALNPVYVKSWLDLISRTPRVAHFLSKGDPLISALKKVWSLILTISLFLLSRQGLPYSLRLCVASLINPHTHTHMDQ